VGLIAVFGLIAILVILIHYPNYLQPQEEEIIIAWWGATNWYIRGPFYQSLLYSIFSTILTGLYLLGFTKVLPK